VLSRFGLLAIVLVVSRLAWLALAKPDSLRIIV